MALGKASITSSLCRMLWLAELPTVGATYTSVSQDGRYPSEAVFAALDTDGRILAWGGAPFLSDASDDYPTDSGHVLITTSASSMAALRSDGTIVQWGLDVGTSAPTGTYTAIYSTYCSFAALTASGSLDPWGCSDGGSGGASQCNGVTAVATTKKAFAAVNGDGTLCAFGHDDFGGIGVPTGSGYTSLYATEKAFAAMNANGELVAWGDDSWGGAGAPSDGGYVAVTAGTKAFCAVKSDNTMTCWGSANSGGHQLSLDPPPWHVASSLEPPPRHVACSHSNRHLGTWRPPDGQGLHVASCRGLLRLCPNRCGRCACKRGTRHSGRE